MAITLNFLRNSATGQILFDANGYPEFATNTGALTYLDMVTRIQTEVLGAITVTNIKNAIQDAISEYERQSFYFNDLRYYSVSGSASDFETVSGKEFYSQADLPILTNMPHISKIMVLAFNNRYPLISRSRQWIDDVSLSTSWNGLPTDWCWQSNSLRLYPIPNGGYPLILDATIRFAPLSADADYNCWTNEAERLIRLEAKRILWKEYLLNDERAASIAQDIHGAPGLAMGELGRLKAESMKRAGGRGKIRPSRGYM